MSSARGSPQERRAGSEAAPEFSLRGASCREDPELLYKFTRKDQTLILFGFERESLTLQRFD